MATSADVDTQASSEGMNVGEASTGGPRCCAGRVRALQRHVLRPAGSRRVG